jgi:transcription termination factor Rho
MTTRARLQELGLDELRAMAGNVDVEHEGLQKTKLIAAILGSDLFDAAMLPEPKEEVPVNGERTTNGRPSRTDGDGGGDEGASNDLQDALDEDRETRSDERNNRTDDQGRDDRRNDNQGGGRGDGQNRDDRRNDNQGGGRGDQGGRPRYQDQGGQDGDGSGRRRRRRGRGGQPDQIDETELEVREGILDILPEGYGFLRCSGYLPGDLDVYVSANHVRKNRLRKGDICAGPIRPARAQEKFPALVRINTVNGLDPEEAKNRPKFADLTPLFPDDRLRLEVDGQAANILPRIVDLIAPIGKAL